MSESIKNTRFVVTRPQDNGSFLVLIMPGSWTVAYSLFGVFLPQERRSSSLLALLLLS